MLIVTDKHTEADLKLWAELEEADLAYCMSDKKEDLAISHIKEFCTSDYYISISWGKDSTVLAHLAYRAKCTNALVSFVRDPSSRNAVYDFNNDLVRNMFLEKYKINSYFEVFYSETGNPEKLKTMRNFEKITGINKCVLGVRAAESGIRKKSLWYHGISTEHKCRPLMKWTTQEIFSYLAKYGLPVHPVYGMTGNGRWDRNRLRVDGAIGGEGGISHGRDIWEREYYQDVLNKIESMRRK
ncbi:MAG: phosphoadenosine phosphosulfate reductase family protein [Desulfobacteraceae bacterium]|jgi:phosphoadenosine phosphosulfate reductase